MRRFLVAGNWKMHGTLASAEALAAGVASGTADYGNVEIAVCPPFVFIAAVRAQLRASAVKVGGQNLSEFESGAYTGEVAAEMLASSGCQYAIIGHSERRQWFGDTNTGVATKLVRAAGAGLTPILCVGETLAEREADETEAVIASQLAPVLALTNAAGLLTRTVIAYEPVWAIGTGLSASPAQAQRVHAFIRAQLAACDANVASAVRILYGGSVKPENAGALFAEPDIDGALVGGAALNAADFSRICQAAHAASH